jgi:dCMP deaminase
MNLKQLYSLRNNFTVIGLTGRTGSGCSKISELLSMDYNYLVEEGLRDENDFDNIIFKQKYTICKNFIQCSDNWVQFNVIKYVDVLLFFILNKYGGNYNKIKDLLLDNYKESRFESNRKIVISVMQEIQKIDSEYTDIINEIKSFKNFENIIARNELEKLESIFFGSEFNTLKTKLFCALNKGGYFRTRLLFHWISCNIRSTGDPLLRDPADIKNIYTIANLINRLIKAKRIVNGHQPTKIVIDSIRNSLELMFFKERYSAFYMLATKDVIGNTRKRINARLCDTISDDKERERLVSKVLELDATEYRTKDFAKGIFSSPDLENCIQKSDYHIFNLKKEHLSEFIKTNCNDDVNGFYTREEQLLKLISLIQLPGIITPSPNERAMQIANTAKLNSGCISRKVGAVITDGNYYIKAVGWNDVAKGQTPCNLRSFEDFFLKNFEGIEQHYSNFEKGESLNNSTFKYKNDTPGNFKDAIIDYFEKPFLNKQEDLNGRNCPFCFKTIHNHYEGEVNQIHTRSLHAEENAMLQISKKGGLGLEEGYLYTTASPCELCSKKAYQIGIKKIYYIDPYPGISINQILKSGSEQPKLIPFSGAIGNAYHKLYDSFMSQKDEISMILELDNGQNLSKKIINVLSLKSDREIIKFISNSNYDDNDIINLLKKGIEALMNNH